MGAAQRPRKISPMHIRRTDTVRASWKEGKLTWSVTGEVTGTRHDKDGLAWLMDDVVFLKRNPRLAYDPPDIVLELIHRDAASDVPLF